MYGKLDQDGDGAQASTFPMQNPLKEQERLYGRTTPEECQKMRKGTICRQPFADKDAEQQEFTCIASGNAKMICCC